jgi:hypothetical protein
MKPPPAEEEHARGYSYDDRDLYDQRSGAGSTGGKGGVQRVGFLWKAAESLDTDANATDQLVDDPFETRDDRRYVAGGRLFSARGHIPSKAAFRGPGQSGAVTATIEEQEYR